MIDIRLTGEFREDQDGILKAGKVFIETDDTEKTSRNFLHKSENYEWLKTVVQKFRDGPGGDTR